MTTFSDESHKQFAVQNDSPIFSILRESADQLTIKRLSNGYVVEGHTLKSGIIRIYCSNLKGVIAQLYKAFEGSYRLSKEQTKAALETLARLGSKKESSKSDKS